VKVSLGADGHRRPEYVQQLVRLKESMTPEQRALYAQLEESGMVPSERDHGA
jgi:hypothetical protein